MRKSVAFLLGFMLCLGLSTYSTSVFAAGTADFSLTSPSTVKQGDTFEVVLNGTGLNNVYGYDVRISFDSDMLTLEDAKTRKDGYPVGPKLKNDEIVCAFTKIGDAAELSGDLSLCTYTFTAKSSGKTGITINTVKLVDKDVKSNEYQVNQQTELTITGSGDGSDDGSDDDSDDDSDEESGSTKPVVVPPSENDGIEKDTDGTVKIVVQSKLDNRTGEATAVIDADKIEKALSIAEADNKGTKKIVLEASKVDGAQKYTIELPSKLVSKTLASNLIELKTSFGTIQIPDNMFTSEQIEGEAKVAITIGALDKSLLSDDLKEKIGNRPVIEINVSAGDKSISWNNRKAPVTVSMDYQPTAEELEDPEHIVVWYIDEQGNAVSVPNGRYDTATNRVTFTTTHFSRFAVAFVRKTFGDLGGYEWAKKAIEIMASKGIINGTSETTFKPSENITRADFMLLLVNAFELKADFDSNFDDVKPDDYYYEALGTAKELGIATGVGNNKYDPRGNISRQDMMCLVDRTLKLAGKDIERGTGEELKKFTDGSDVRPYALESVASLVKSGLIAGDGTKVMPLDNTLRAEAAMLMYRLYYLQ